MTRCIDVQAHYVPEAQRTAIAVHAATDPAFARAAGWIAGDPQGPLAKACSVDDGRVAEMDAAGIDVQVLSLMPPGVAFGDPFAASRANDGLLEAAGRYPGRFVVLASLPLPDVDESIAELERAGAHPLCRGVMMHVGSGRWLPDEPRFEPLYVRMAELGLPLVLHPDMQELPGYEPWGLAAVAMVASSTLGALRLVLSGLLDRVPGLELIVPHLGGTIPFIAQRVVDHSGTGEAQHDLFHYLRTRMYFDSCSGQPAAIRFAAEVVGAQRIMLGSDYPFRGESAPHVRDVRESGLAEAERAAILGETAERWFG